MMYCNLRNEAFVLIVKWINGILDSRESSRYFIEISFKFW